jgi:putative N-acetyltransferase (TIGR04045 family)
VHELAACYHIRRKIFVDEQGLFKETDCDEIDKRAIHIVALSKAEVIGTVRVYQEKPGVWWGGRLAVVKKYRGMTGKLLIQKAIEIARESGAHVMYANVQATNAAFFRRLQWRPCGDVVTYQGKPHQLMTMELGGRDVSS